MYKLKRIFIILILVLVLCSCGKDKHEHEFANEYTFNNSHHWYECASDDCEEKQLYEEHEYDVKVLTQENKEITMYTCKKCEYEYSDEKDKYNVEILPLKILLNDKEYLDGVTNQYESEVVYHASSNPNIIFTSTDDALQKHPELFKKYPNAKAVVCVHLYGTPAKLDEIMAICEEHKVPFIEDAAESLGATYKGRYEKN